MSAFRSTTCRPSLLSAIGGREGCLRSTPDSRRGNPRPPSLPRRPAAVISIVAIAFSGCGLEKPKAPVIESDVYLPIGDLRYTAGELVESVGVIEGDTTVAEPVRVEFSGSFDPVDLRSRLEASLAERMVTASHGAVEIEVPAIRSPEFSLGEIAPFEIPPEGLVLTVPRLALRPISEGLPRYPEFEEGRIRSGLIAATLRNDLPIPIENLVVRVVDESGDELGRIEQLLRLDPNRSSVFQIDLAGRTIHDSVRVDLLSGTTPGSDGPVRLDRDQAIRIDLEVRDLRFAEVRAPLPAFAFEVRDSVALDAAFRVESAVIESARIPLRLTNGLPLAIDATLTLPEVVTGSGPFRRSYRVEAGGTLHDEVRLDGDSLRFPTSPEPQALTVVATVAYEGSGERVVHLMESMSLRAWIGAFTVRLASLTGILEPQEIAIPPARARFDLPDETEGIEFADARLDLIVENGTRAPANVDLIIRGVGTGGTAEARLAGVIRAAGAGGPLTTRLTFTPRNSAILDVVNARPEEITIEGSAIVGDANETVTVRAEDAIRGSYLLTSPLRVRIHDATFEPDPFEIRIEEDLRERIREDLIGAEAEARILNHFPFAAEVQIRFASDSSRVHSAPDVVLAPVRVEPGFIDAASGRTVAERVTEARLSVDRADVPFFAGRAVYGGGVIHPDSSGSRPLEVMTTDWIEVGGMIRFTVEVGGP